MGQLDKVLVDTYGFTEKQIESIILHHLLRRMSDGPYDREQAARFKGMSPEEIKQLLIQDAAEE